MTITINGTTGISGVDGSSGTPAYQGNDANTGISFGTDIVTINTGGTARVTTDSSGRLLVGTSTAPSSNAVREVLTGGTSNYLQFTSTTNDGFSLGNSGGSGVFFTFTGAQGSETYTERMRIDSSGNVGIGTSSPSGILDARGAVYLGNTSTGTTTFVRGASNWNFAGLNVIRNAANTGNPRSIAMPLDGDNLASTTIGEYNAIWGAYDSSPTTSSTSSALNGAMVYGAYAGHRWVTNGTERMRIDSSGNVGIGTTSPAARLSSNVSGAGSVTALNLTNSNTGLAAGTGPAINFGINDSTTLGAFGKLEVLNETATTGSNSYMTFFTRSADVLAEKMRITSGGRVLVNSTSDVGGNNPAFSVNAENASAFSNIMEARWTGTASIYHLLVRNGNGLIGGVTSSGSTTAFVTSSDYRLKENVAPMQNALATVAALKPVTYTWKADGSNGQGFIAHELQAVVPDCVTGEKDAVDKDGKPQHQGVDTSFLVATLVSAIQELTARLEALENK